jgi:NAD(P)-dependent dehydrogenase (short-subunit alcohol dehydrogenase family)
LSAIRSIILVAASVSMKPGETVTTLTPLGRPLLPHGASIIPNSSIVASKGLPINSVSATKAAIRSFARTWTTDLKDRRIRVNAVSQAPLTRPGSVASWLPPKLASNVWR